MRTPGRKKLLVAVSRASRRGINNWSGGSYTMTRITVGGRQRWAYCARCAKGARGANRAVQGSGTAKGAKARKARRQLTSRSCAHFSAVQRFRCRGPRRSRISRNSRTARNTLDVVPSRPLCILHPARREARLRRARNRLARRAGRPHHQPGRSRTPIPSGSKERPCHAWATGHPYSQGLFSSQLRSQLDFVVCRPGIIRRFSTRYPCSPRA